MKLWTTQKEAISIIERANQRQFKAIREEIREEITDIKRLMMIGVTGIIAITMALFNQIEWALIWFGLMVIFGLFIKRKKI